MSVFRRRKKCTVDVPETPVEQVSSKGNSKRAKRHFRFKIPFLSRLDMYLLKKFLGTYIFSILLIITIVVVFDYTQNANKFTENGATMKQVFSIYYPNFIPFIIISYSSLFVFISVIFFTTKLAGNSEIIAMQAAGVKFTRIMRPYFIASALIAGVSFYLGSEIVPQGNIKRLNFENQYKRKAINKEKDPTEIYNMQMQVDTGVIAFVGTYHISSKIGERFILDKFENKKLISHLTADKIEYDSLNAEKYHWKIYYPIQRELKTNTEKITRVNKIVDSLIVMEPNDFVEKKHMEQSLTNQELRERIEIEKIRGTGHLAKYEIEYNKRFADPFSAFIMSTIGLTLSSKKRKNGLGLALGIGIALTACYIFAQTVFATYAVNAGFTPMLAAWVPNIIFAIIAAFLYKKAQK